MGNFSQVNQAIKRDTESISSKRENQVHLFIDMILYLGKYTDLKWMLLELTNKSYKVWWAKTSTQKPTAHSNLNNDLSKKSNKQFVKPVLFIIATKIKLL